jgi:hypothetical protein
MSSEQSVNLILKTTQISSSNTVASYYELTVSNEYGSIGENRTAIKWNNINLKTLMGDMYDKYDRFNISLNYIGGAACGTAAETSADNRIFMVKLSGLPFTSSYNLTTNANNGTAVLTIADVPLEASSTWSYTALSEKYFTFMKQEMVNISIDLHTILNDTYYIPSANTKMLGHMVFSFNIYGVNDFEKNIVSHRIKNL